MKQDDYDTFAEVWSSAYELTSRGKAPSANALLLAFDALSMYPLSQVTAALSSDVRDPDAGRYGLTPSDVVRQIDGEKPSQDQIIAAALKPRTPLAVLCRIEIGSWNLQNLDRHQLRPYAEECIASLPAWRRRIARGEVTAHEIERIAHYGASMDSHRLSQCNAGAPPVVARGLDEDPGDA